MSGEPIRHTLGYERSSDGASGKSSAHRLSMRASARLGVVAVLTSDLCDALDEPLDLVRFQQSQNLRGHRQED
jgi:hypothetical protein